MPEYPTPWRVKEDEKSGTPFIVDAIGEIVAVGMNAAIDDRIVAHENAYEKVYEAYELLRTVME